VLYECLTGRVPFEKDLDAAIIWAHVEESPTLPTLLRPDLPPAIDEVFARVLAKRPGDRYETCREFMIAAREALGPMAEPPSPSGSLQMRMPRSGPVPYPAEPFSPERAYAFSPEGAYPPGSEGAYQPGAEGAYQPAELAHEAANAFNAAPTANWPAMDVPSPPPPPGPPMPPGLSGRGRARRRRNRRRGWLVALVALIVAGAAAGVTLSLTGGKGTPVAGGAKTLTAGTPVNSSSAMASPATSAGMSSMSATAPAGERDPAHG
jgi:hypothetical protein